MHAQHVLNIQPDVMPLDLLRAHERHTGRDMLNGQPTGREPTNDLCTFCAYFIGAWLDMAIHM